MLSDAIHGQASQCFTCELSCGLSCGNSADFPDITVTVTETESQTLENTATTAEPGTSAGTSSSNDGGCASTVSGIVLLIPALLGVALVGWKRKDE